MARQDIHRKPKARITLASFYLAAALAVCFIVLTRLLPATAGVVDERIRMRHTDAAGWYELAMHVSAWTSNHRSLCITTFTLTAIGGFVLPFLVRRSRYVIWLAALAVFLVDVAFVAIGFGSMFTGLLQEAGNLNR